MAERTQCVVKLGKRDQRLKRKPRTTAGSAGRRSFLPSSLLVRRSGDVFQHRSRAERQMASVRRSDVHAHLTNEFANAFTPTQFVKLVLTTSSFGSPKTVWLYLTKTFTWAVNARLPRSSLGDHYDPPLRLRCETSPRAFHGFHRGKSRDTYSTLSSSRTALVR